MIFYVTFDELDPKLWQRFMAPNPPSLGSKEQKSPTGHEELVEAFSHFRQAFGDDPELATFDASLAKATSDLEQFGILLGPFSESHRHHTY